MKYHLIINNIEHDIFYCYACEETYLFPVKPKPKCQYGKRHKLSRHNIGPVLLEFLYSYVVCNNCNNYRYKGIVSSINCPKCRAGKYVLLSQVMNL